MKTSLTDAICKITEKNDDSAIFWDRISKQGEIYLFGGAVRDFMENRLDEIRDLDFVVDFGNNSRLSLDRYFSNFRHTIVRRNRFGGYKLSFGSDLTVDIWLLRDTWAFRQKYFPATIHNLLKTVYLDIDSLIYDMNESCYIDNCDNTWKTIKQLGMTDMVFQKCLCEELNLLRAFTLARKYSLALSPQLRLAFSKHASHASEFLKTLLKIQLLHYNKLSPDFLQMRVFLSEILNS